MQITINKIGTAVNDSTFTVDEKEMTYNEVFTHLLNEGLEAEKILAQLNDEFDSYSEEDVVVDMINEVTARLLSRFKYIINDDGVTVYLLRIREDAEVYRYVTHPVISSMDMELENGKTLFDTINGLSI